MKNLLSMDQIHRAVKADYNLFMWDFKHITHLENGMTVNPRRFSGFSYIGPYPLESQEAAYDVKRFRRKSGIWGGWGEIPMYYLYLPGKNAEDWGSKGTFALRLELWYEMPNQDLYLGKYDTFVSFTREKNNYFKIPSINRLAPVSTLFFVPETPGELGISYDFSRAILPVRFMSVTMMAKKWGLTPPTVLRSRTRLT
ncbi:MAG: hypothetical protein U5N86_09270 [Planctomycetota bacterium]|nr:hypothetical protein [Planctomycetota bacterium]